MVRRIAKPSRTTLRRNKNHHLLHGVEHVGGNAIVFISLMKHDIQDLLRLAAIIKYSFAIPPTSRSEQQCHRKPFFAVRGRIGIQWYSRKRAMPGKITL